MDDNYTLHAERRADAGKGASRRLRRTGKVPGIVYGANSEPVMIEVSHNELVRRLENEAFYSHILDIDIGGTIERAVLKDLQRHPAKPFIMHLDLQRVRAGEKLRMQIPLHFINEETAVGVKMGGAVAHTMNEVEVTCLPQDLPEYIEVDVGGLDIGDSLRLSDLKVPEGVELSILAAGGDEQVVSISVLRKEEVEGEEGEPGEEGFGVGEAEPEPE